MRSIGMLQPFLAATILEVSGDAIIRIDLQNHAGVTVLIGGALIVDGGLSFWKQ